MTSKEQTDYDVALSRKDQLMMLHCIAELLDDIRVELKRSVHINELVATNHTPGEIRRALRGR